MADNSSQDVALEVASLKAEVRSDIRNLAHALDDLKLQIEVITGLREELAKFGIHHNQFRDETKTIWMRIDSNREAIEHMQKTINQWIGGIRMLIAVTGVLGAIGGSILTWTWWQVTAMPVMAEKVRNLEIRK